VTPTGQTRTVTAVVLAGGSSRRFGGDKLAASLHGVPLLTSVITSLPPDWSVVVVGPEREVGRTVTFVRENPPGSGPAAALLTGVRATTGDVVLTVPGDSPGAGRVAARLLGALADHDRVVAADDQPNPLWLGLRDTALDRVRAGEPTSWAGASAQALMRWIDPVSVSVPAVWLTDVDVPEDLARITGRRD